MLNPYTILLADDDANSVVLIERAFRDGRLVHPLQVVDDGEKTMDYLLGRAAFGDRRRFPFPGLLLLDLRMPRFDGFEVLEAIRKNPLLRMMLVVVLTSSDDRRDINRAYQLGANSYLVKPVNFRALVDLVIKIEQYWAGLNQRPCIQIPLR